MPWINHYWPHTPLQPIKKIDCLRKDLSIKSLLLGTQSLQSLQDLLNPHLHFLSAANRREDSADRSEQKEGKSQEEERGDCRRAELVMSGFMARETAAGGGRIDGWHIISLLIAAPQNWIASRGLWSVRIWLMSPTPLLSPDSSLLSGPGLGFLSFPLTAIPPPRHPSIHCLLHAVCILTLCQVKRQLRVCWPGLSIHLSSCLISLSSTILACLLSLSLSRAS